MKIYLVKEDSGNKSIDDVAWVTDEEKLAMSNYRKLSERNKSLVRDLINILD